MNTWAQPKPQPWPLESQVVAMGMEVPTVTNGDGWHFLSARLFVHCCRVKDCLHCREWKRMGARTLRVTREQIADGTALDWIGAETWGKVEGGLF